MIFWILPILIAINVKTGNATKIYAGYMISYYGTLVFIFLYHWGRYGLPKWLVSMIETPHWIIETTLEIIAEWCLTNVLLSDLLYFVLMRFRLNQFDQE